MIVVRALAAIAKPALVSGALGAAAIGGWFVVDQWGSDGAPTPFAAVQDAGQRLIVNEFGEHADTIVAIDPADPSVRTVIATIDHAPGWGSFATLSPDGQSIAYTAIPADASDPGPETPAHAAIVDADGTVTLLADDVDLLIAPVWAPDGSGIVVRKNTPEDDGAGSFELLLLGRDGSRTTLSAWQSAAVFPVAFSPDGAKLYFTTLNADGTDLYSIAPDGTGEALVAHLSDEIARDWRLSPDGARLAFSVAESGPQPGIAARVLDLQTGAISDAIPADATLAGPPATGVARGEFNPAWTPDGGLTVAAIAPDGGAEAIAVDESGAAAVVLSDDDAMTLPLDWSPDGATLVVRSVEGRTPFEAGASYVELVQADGTRERLSENSDTEVVGWLE